MSLVYYRASADPLSISLIYRPYSMTVHLHIYHARPNIITWLDDVHRSLLCSVTTYYPFCKIIPLAFFHKVLTAGVQFFHETNPLWSSHALGRI